MLDFSAPTRQNAFKKIKSMMIAKKRNVFKISNVVEEKLANDKMPIILSFLMKCPQKKIKIIFFENIVIFRYHRHQSEYFNIIVVLHQSTQLISNRC